MMDWERLAELRDEVGEDALAEVLEMFLEETDAVAERLKDTINPDTLGSDMHFMKGAALNIGFSDLAKLCHEAETAAARGRAAEIDVPQILDCYRLSREALTQNETFAALVA